MRAEFSVARAVRVTTAWKIQTISPSVARAQDIALHGVGASGIKRAVINAGLADSIRRARSVFFNKVTSGYQAEAANELVLFVLVFGLLEDGGGLVRDGRAGTLEPVTGVTGSLLDPAHERELIFDHAVAFGIACERVVGEVANGDGLADLVGNGLLDDGLSLLGGLVGKLDVSGEFANLSADGDELVLEHAVTLGVAGEGVVGKSTGSDKSGLKT